MEAKVTELGQLAGMDCLVQKKRRAIQASKDRHTPDSFRLLLDWRAANCIFSNYEEYFWRSWRQQERLSQFSSLVLQTQRKCSTVWQHFRNLFHINIYCRACFWHSCLEWIIYEIVCCRIFEMMTCSRSFRKYWQHIIGKKFFNSKIALKLRGRYCIISCFVADSWRFTRVNDKYMLQIQLTMNLTFFAILQSNFNQKLNSSYIATLLGK